MNSSLFTAKNIIVQGITGAHGRFQTKAMLAAGTTVVAGTTPGKGGQSVEGVPVYNTIHDIQAVTTVDATVIFVPAAHAKAAIIEAIEANIPLIACITEGIPVHDMLVIREKLMGSDSTLLGPNSPGFLIPSGNKLGIIPAGLAKPGTVAIVSRSGTLTYETMAGLSDRGIGQRYIIGIGGDQIHGIGFIECLELLEHDPGVTAIVLIGEIGGNEELLAADYIKTSVTKPVFAYIAGQYAPAGVQLGHAGAILGSAGESASAKNDYLGSQGITIATSVSELIDTLSRTKA